MSKQRRLKAQALESCRFRGHKMGKFFEVLPLYWAGKARVFIATCKVCGKEVAVNLKPAANEIEIGGEAVALGCEK